MSLNQHLTMAELLALARARESPDAIPSEDLEAHVEHCPTCSALLAMTQVQAEPQPQLDTTPTTVDGRFELLGELGQGGMGEAWLAYDNVLGREVVLKFPRKVETRMRAAFEARLATEAVITAGLSHPSIVAVYETGQLADGRPFYAMPYIAGIDLEQAIASRSSLQERLRLLPRMSAVAFAIAHAHERAVVHRDIKPQNIRLGRNAQTTVLDWGLASRLRDVDEADGAPAPKAGPMTAAGVGTPGYMAPEQAAGRPALPPMDVYALGATLVHLLSGEHPKAVNPAEALPPETPPDLRSLCARATAFDASARYRDASEFANELLRYLEGQLLAAHDYDLSDLLLRFAKRHWRALAAGSVLVAGGITAALLLGRAERAEDRVRELDDQVRIELARSQASQAALLSNSPGRRGEALALAVQAVSQPGLDAATRLHAQGTLATVLARGPTSEWLDGAPGGGLLGWVMPTSSWAAHAAPDGTLRRFGAGELSPSASVAGPTALIHHLQPNPAAPELAYVDHAAGAGIASWATGEFTPLAGVGAEPNPGCWMGERLAVAGPAQLLVFDASGKQLDATPSPGAAANAACVDGRFIAAGTEPWLMLWTPGHDPQRLALPGPAAAIHPIAQGAWIVTKDGSVNELSCPASPEQPCTLAPRASVGASVYIPGFDPSGTQLVVTSNEMQERAHHFFALEPGGTVQPESRVRFGGWPNDFDLEGKTVVDPDYAGQRLQLRPTLAPWLVLPIDARDDGQTQAARADINNPRARLVPQLGPAGQVWAGVASGTLTAHFDPRPGHGATWGHARGLLWMRTQGQHMVSAALDGTVAIHGPEALQAAARLPAAPVLATSSPRNERHAAADADGQIWTWTGTEPATPHHRHADVVRALSVDDAGGVTSFDADAEVHGAFEAAPAPSGGPAVASLEAFEAVKLEHGLGARLNAQKQLQLWGLAVGDRQWTFTLEELETPTAELLDLHRLGPSRVLLSCDAHTFVIDLQEEEVQVLAGRMPQSAGVTSDFTRVVTLEPGVAAQVHVLDTAKAPGWRVPELATAIELALSPQGDTLAALMPGGRVEVHRQGSSPWVFETHALAAIEFDATGQWLWLGHADGRVQALPSDPAQLHALACTRLAAFPTLAQPAGCPDA